MLSMLSLALLSCMLSWSRTLQLFSFRLFHFLNLKAHHSHDPLSFFSSGKPPIGQKLLIFEIRNAKRAVRDFVGDMRRNSILCRGDHVIGLSFYESTILFYDPCFISRTLKCLFVTAVTFNTSCVLTEF